MPRLERERAADPSRGIPQATDVFEVAAFGAEVRVCETRDLARLVARKLRVGFREVGAPVLLGHADFEAWLRGKIAYVAMVDPARGERLRAALDALPAG